MEKNKENFQIDLRMPFARIRQFSPWILLVAVICGGALWCLSTFFMTPLYNASATVYVYSDGTSNRNESMYVTYSELYAAQYLADPYIAVLQSDNVLQKVADQIGLDITPTQLRKYLKITGGENSLILTITASHPDPEVACNIVRGITRVAPDEIKRVIKAGGFSVIDEAKLPKAPSSPNVMRNTIAGAVGGAFLLTIILLLREFFNSSIRSEEDITNDLDVPILGTIPQIDHAAKDGKS